MLSNFRRHTWTQPRDNQAEGISELPIANCGLEIRGSHAPLTIQTTLWCSNQAVQTGGWAVVYVVKVTRQLKCGGDRNRIDQDLVIDRGLPLAKPCDRGQLRVGAGSRVQFQAIAAADGGRKGLRQSQLRGFCLNISSSSGSHCHQSSDVGPRLFEWLLALRSICPSGLATFRFSASLLVAIRDMGAPVASPARQFTAIADSIPIPRQAPLSANITLQFF